MSNNFQSDHAKMLATPVTELAELFRVLRFMDADKEKDLGKDLTADLKRMPYLRRVHHDQHQHLSLVTNHTGLFLEAVLMVYVEPYNSRAKSPKAPLHSGLYRTMPELLVAVDKVYELPKKA